MTQTDALKTTMQQFVEQVWNKGNLSAVDELLATDAAMHMGIGQVVGLMARRLVSSGQEAIYSTVRC